MKILGLFHISRQDPDERYATGYVDALRDAKKSREQDGVRDGAGVAAGHDRDTRTTRTTTPHRLRRDHSYLRLVTS